MVEELQSSTCYAILLYLTQEGCHNLRLLNSALHFLLQQKKKQSAENCLTVCSQQHSSSFVTLQAFVFTASQTRRV